MHANYFQLIFLHACVHVIGDTIYSYVVITHCVNFHELWFDMASKSSMAVLYEKHPLVTIMSMIPKKVRKFTGKKVNLINVFYEHGISGLRNFNNQRSAKARKEDLMKQIQIYELRYKQVSPDSDNAKRILTLINNMKKTAEELAKDEKVIINALYPK